MSDYSNREAASTSPTRPQWAGILPAAALAVLLLLIWAVPEVRTWAWVLLVVPAMFWVKAIDEAWTKRSRVRERMR